jgi:hypothetical protein
MKRSALTHSDASRLTVKPKKRTCKACKAKFETFAPSFVNWCSPECGAVLAQKKLDAQRVKIAKESRIATRIAKAALKTRSDWMKEAQAAFNAFVRERDRQAGFPCISSGRPLDWTGNNVDAGHYRSRGSAPHLRFDERNCHAQSKQDNRYGAGRAVDYRIGLIARIGLEAVEALEADNKPRKWTIDELKAIKATYKAKLRALLAERQNNQ